MKVVRIDELSLTEQRHAPAVAGRAATRRRRRRAGPPLNFSDDYEILTQATSQHSQQL
jgi:hypothetical protein